ncbi:hypothetical protein OIU81_42170 (plasmid) [Streptomyces sp. NBC_01454]|uniref:hypothetical protein n=1 Tax=Streptomyces sp. NBC_01454 TaxID=2975867 RepID=UPI002E371BEC|nr:hypothetical protein [Streptomyces sp. NBC_01454]
MTTKTPAELSDAAAEAIRGLNHATQAAKDGFEHPGDAYSVIGNPTLAQRLPQALDQIAQFVTRLETEGHLRSDRERNLADEVAAVTAGLRMSTDDAEALADHLNAVHSALSPLAWKD